MKRFCLWMALVALTAALVLPLGGCGSNKFTEWGIEDITDMSKVPESYELPFGNGETITYSGPDNWYAPASLSKNLPVYREAESRMNIKFDWQVLASEQWNISMKTRINGGRELPDIMGLPDWGVANIDEYSREQVIIPLNELINKYAPNIKRILNEYPELRRQMTSADGGIYSLNDFFMQNEYYMGVLIREDWLNNLGLEIPETVEEYEAVLTAFRDRDPNQNGEQDEIPLFVVGGYQYDYLASMAGMSVPLQDTVIDENGNAVYQKATKEYGTFLAWLNRLYTTQDQGGLGVMDLRYEAGNQTSFEADVGRNLVGMTVAPGDYADKYTKIAQASGDTDAKYIMIDPPVPEKGDEPTLVKRSLTGGQIGISIDCEDPVLAIRVMDYLWGSEEGNILLQYGLTAEEAAKYSTANNPVEATYEMVGETPQLTDWVLNNPNGLDAGSALRTIGAWGPLFDRQTKEFLDAFFPEQVIEYYASATERGLFVDPFPNILSTQEEMDAFQAMMTDFNTYQQEMSLKFILGQVPMSSYESTYLPQMETLKIREYEALRKAQYDRYMQL